MQQESPQAPAFPETERRREPALRSHRNRALRMGPEFSLKEDTSAQEDRAAE